MSVTLELRTQQLTHYEEGDPCYSIPKVLAESCDYKFLKLKQAEYEAKAREDGEAENTIFWITPQPRKLKSGVLKK